MRFLTRLVVNESCIALSALCALRPVYRKAAEMHPGIFYFSEYVWFFSAGRNFMGRLSWFAHGRTPLLFDFKLVIGNVCRQFNVGVVGELIIAGRLESLLLQGHVAFGVDPQDQLAEQPAQTLGFGD
jgi:hypothetical protein